MDKRSIYTLCHPSKRLLGTFVSQLKSLAGGHHARMRAVSRFIPRVIELVFLASTALAQFTGSIQGVVQDKSGAGIGKADVQLVSVATGVVATTTTDASGNYRFLSLAPGSYK